MKKLAAIAAVCILTAGVLVSCKSDSGSSSVKPSAGTSEAVSVSETETSQMQGQLASLNPEALDKAREKASEYAQKNNLDTGGFIPPEKEAEDALKSCITAMYTEGVNGTLKYFYPEKLYDAIISGKAKEYFNGQEDTDAEVTEFHITKSVRLAPNTGYGLAEKYFSVNAEKNGVSDLAIKVVNGYSVEAEFKVKTSEGVDSDKEEMVLVELEEDGWKVIPLSVEQLKQILE